MFDSRDKSAKSSDCTPVFVATTLRPDGRWADGRYTPSRLASITTCGSALAPSPRRPSGYSRSAETDVRFVIPNDKLYDRKCVFLDLPTGVILHENRTILASSCDCVASLCRRYERDDRRGPGALTGAL